jgi:hypothetical protein
MKKTKIKNFDEIKPKLERICGEFQIHIGEYAAHVLPKYVTIAVKEKLLRWKILIEYFKEAKSYDLMDCLKFIKNFRNKIVHDKFLCMEEIVIFYIFVRHIADILENYQNLTELKADILKCANEILLILTENLNVIIEGTNFFYQSKLLCFTNNSTLFNSLKNTILNNDNDNTNDTNSYVNVNDNNNVPDLERDNDNNNNTNTYVNNNGINTYVNNVNNNNNGNDNNLIIKLSNEMTIEKYKEMYGKPYLKGKRVKLADGSFKGEFGIFDTWNGSNCYISCEDTGKHAFPLIRRIQVCLY